MRPATRERAGAKIPDAVRVEQGRALARTGDGGWDPLIQQGLRDGVLADELVAACAELVRGWSPNPAPEWACAVPSLRAPTLVAGFAQRLASVLELPLVPLVERVVDSPPQREMRNASQQLENVLRAFKVSESAAGDARPAGRRRALLRLDARGDRRAAAGRRKRSGVPAGARQHRHLAGER